MEFNSLDSIAKSVEEFQNKLKETVKPALLAAVKELKEHFPTATRVYGYFYTPYFNDGDECVYGVHGVFITTEESKQEGCDEYGEYEDGGEDLSYLSKTSYSKQQIEMGKDFVNNLEAIKDGLKAAFGDHQKITIDLINGKVISEFWEHD